MSCPPIGDVIGIAHASMTRRIRLMVAVCAVIVVAVPLMVVALWSTLRSTILLGSSLLLLIPAVLLQVGVARMVRIRADLITSTWSRVRFTRFFAPGSGIYFAVFDEGSGSSSSPVRFIKLSIRQGRDRGVGWLVLPRFGDDASLYDANGYLIATGRAVGLSADLIDWTRKLGVQ